MLPANHPSRPQRVHRHRIRKYARTTTINPITTYSTVPSTTPVCVNACGMACKLEKVSEEGEGNRFSEKKRKTGGYRCWWSDAHLRTSTPAPNKLLQRLTVPPIFDPSYDNPRCVCSRKEKKCKRLVSGRSYGGIFHTTNDLSMPNVSHEDSPP